MKSGTRSNGNAKYTNSSQRRIRTPRGKLESAASRRNKRNAARPVKAVAESFANAVAEKDEKKLAATLASDVRLDGESVPSTVAAERLVTKLAGTRSVSRRAADGFAQITLLGDDGVRFLVRVEVKNNVGVAVDVR